MLLEFFFDVFAPEFNPISELVVGKRGIVIDWFCDSGVVDVKEDDEIFLTFLD